MKIKCVYAVYFSPTGNTEKACETAARELAHRLGAPCKALDFTLPEGRRSIMEASGGGKCDFGPDELVVFGVPTYAGRVPNKILPLIGELFSGAATPCVALVSFGNRSSGGSLKELMAELDDKGFKCFAGASLCASHAFSDKIGEGRPDALDIEKLLAFSGSCAAHIKNSETVDGMSYGRSEIGPYYTPLGLDGEPKDFLKAKPETDAEKCDGCGLCERLCPMGSVKLAENAVPETPGLCIKCHSCIARCPKGARSIKDPAFLSHRAMLERTYLSPAPSEFYLGGELVFATHAGKESCMDKESPLDAVLFDLDGTLWDPTLAVAATWNEVFSESGEALRLTRDEVKGLMGMRMEEIAEKLFPDKPEEESAAIIYNCGLGEIAYLSEHGGEPYPKLRETLESLKSMGLKLGIISNCQENYIGSFFKGHGLGYLFEDYEESGRTGLSKGMNIRLVMDRCGMKNAVYVGDTVRDGEAAKEAGLSFIHAGYGLGRVDEADAVLSEIAELPALLKSLYKIE